MKSILILCSALIGFAIMLSLPACSTSGEPPDPELIQQQIAESRKQELDLVRETVADPDRAERVIEALATRDELIEQYSEEINAHRERMNALSADYNTTRSALEAQLTLYNRQRAAAQLQFVDLVGAMKRETTADEWKTISKFQLKRMNPRQLTYGTAKQGG
jgi:hypothetical protein